MKLDGAAIVGHLLHELFGMSRKECETVTERGQWNAAVGLVETITDPEGKDKQSAQIVFAILKMYSMTATERSEHIDELRKAAAIEDDFHRELARACKEARGG